MKEYHPMWLGCRIDLTFSFGLCTYLLLPELPLMARGLDTGEASPIATICPRNPLRLHQPQAGQRPEDPDAGTTIRHVTLNLPTRGCDGLDAVYPGRVCVLEACESRSQQ